MPDDTEALTARLREVIGRKVPKDPGGMTYGEAMMKKLLAKALGGDVKAIALIVELTEGGKGGAAPYRFSPRTAALEATG